MATIPLPPDSEIATAVCEALPAETEIAAVYLFGSAAAGRLRPDSDVDIAFLGAGAVDPIVAYDAAQRLASRLGRDVDLIDLRRTSTILRGHIVADGRRLMAARRNIVEEFEMYALSDYALFQEERRPVVEAMQARYRG
jgi:predicted nucleotidyltransferase